MMYKKMKSIIYGMFFHTNYKWKGTVKLRELRKRWQGDM